MFISGVAQIAWKRYIYIQCIFGDLFGTGIHLEGKVRFGEARVWGFKWWEYI